MILVIDLYDSFTYNLVQMLGELDKRPVVKRSDDLSLAQIEQMAPDFIFISSGSGGPKTAKFAQQVVQHFSGKIPIFGVGLGHQVIAHAFGGEVEQVKEIEHGKVSPILHDGKTIFSDFSDSFKGTHYHSFVVKKQGLPDCFEVSAWTSEGEIMGLRHKEFALESVQFNIDSIMTEAGTELLANFLQLYRMNGSE